MPDNPRQIVCTACFARQRRLLVPCEKCGSRKLAHVRFLIQTYGREWKAWLEADRGKVH